MRRPGRFVLGVALTVAIGACTIMNGYELPASVENGGDSGASSSGGPKKDGGSTTLADGRVVPTDSGSACTLNHPPAKPAPAGGTDSPNPVEVALESMLADSTAAPLGYDLDNLCTCPGPPACVTKGQEPCDSNGDGTDNAGSSISKGLAGVFNPVDNANQRIASGQTGFLIRLASYNLTANDEAVQVTIFRSNGVAADNVDFTQTQPWPASARSSVSTTAWVNNNTLVANFDSVEVPFLDSVPSPAKLQHAMLVGQIVPGTTPTIQSALLVGRAPTNDMIASIGQNEVSNGGGFYVCQAPQYSGLGTATCAQQDINLDPNADAVGTANCDALSLTVSMTLVPATIVAPQPIPQVSDHCSGQPAIQCN